MIRRLAIGLVLLPLIIVPGCGEELPQGAIAQVGVALVSQDQFDKLKAAYVGSGHAPDEDKQPEEYRRFERGLVEYLVVLEILRQEASVFGVIVTEQEVQEELEQIKQMFQGDEEAFEEALDEQNMTLEQLTQSIRDSLWLNEMKSAVTGEMTVDDEETRAYYEAHRADYVEQESRDVRHILISPYPVNTEDTLVGAVGEADWDAAKAEAEKVRSEIQNGADFVTEAEKYSDDEPTKASGGELGAVVRGQTIPAFEEAVFSLQKGELSQPVRTQYGYHLIQVTDITPERQLSYEQVKESIRSALLEQKQAETWERWLAEKKLQLGVVYKSGYGPSSGASVTAEESSPSESSE